MTSKNKKAVSLTEFDTYSEVDKKLKEHPNFTEFTMREEDEKKE